jgi:MFS family permease
MVYRTPEWLTREVLLISLSAFFADLGYQAVIGLFPIFVTFILKQPAYVFGLLMSFSYGVGSLFSYIGGRLGDRFSKKKLSLAGNLLIPLLSFSGLPANIFESSSLYLGGWWSRNFRSPPRRALLVELSDPQERSRIFGFLHLLDVGGGMLSGIIAFFLVYSGFSVPFVMLLTVIPILVSSLSLSMVRENRRTESGKNLHASDANRVENDSAMKLFLVSAGLFGFSYYSLGFPIITVARVENNYAFGLLTYAVFLGASGISGYFFGSRRLKPAGGLWMFGYSIAAIGSLSIGITYLYHLGLLSFYLSAAVLGIGTGSIETFEPVVAALLVVPQRISRGMGSLGAWRSIGLFSSNLLMGILFTFNIFDSYLYAFITSALAALLMARVQLRTNSLR